MWNAIRQPLSLVMLTALCVFFINLGGPRLFDEDEPKNAACAREMMEAGNWLVPKFNGDLRTHKPIMVYWFMLCSYAVFGVTEFSARLPSALLATGTVFTVYQIGLTLFDRRSAMYAAIMLATSMMYVAVARAATPDATLIFFTTFAFYAFLKASASSPSSVFRMGSGTDSPPESLKSPGWPSDYASRINPWLVASYISMGFAVLSKGPVGFLIPCSAIGLYLMWTADLQWLREHRTEARQAAHGAWTRLAKGIVRFWSPRRFWQALRSMKPHMIALLVGSIALPWYIAVSVATNGEWLAGFLGEHNVGRFLSPMEKHAGPIYYYVPVISMGFFPWSLFFPAAVWALYSFGKSNDSTIKERSAMIFLLSWTLAYVVFFSIAQTKLPNYVLPSYPAFALMTGWGLSRWQTAATRTSERLVYYASYGYLAVGVAVLVALPVASAILMPGIEWVGMLGLILILGGVVALQRFWRADRAALMQTVMVYSVLFVIAAFAGAAHFISRYQEGTIVGQSAIVGERAGQIGTYNYWSPNLNFYGKQVVDRLNTATDAKRFLYQSENPYLLMREKTYEKVRNLLPADTGEVKRIRRFLRTEDVVVVGRKSQQATDSVAARAGDLRR